MRGNCCNFLSVVIQLNHKFSCFLPPSELTETEHDLSRVLNVIDIMNKLGAWFTKIKFNPRYNRIIVFSTTTR